MFKKVIFVVMYLNLLKSLANGFVVDTNENDTFNQWLQPINIVSAPFKQWFVNNTYPNQNEKTSMQLTDTSDTLSEKKELPLESNSEPIKNTSTLETSSPTNQPPELISHVLGTLQAEINNADNEGKKRYMELLTDLEQKFAQKSRYARVFFNQMWHVVDLGLYGSSQRRRDASALDGMLKPLRDLLKWLYRNLIDLLTWNIATDDDEDDEDDKELSERQKKKKEENDGKEPSTHEDGGIKVTTKVGENGVDRHKLVHKFEIDPFVVKLNMDITCRILDDSKNPTKPETSSTHQEGKIKVHTKPLDAKTDDWDYTSTKQKLEADKKKLSSGSSNDSKPSATPDDKSDPIPPSAGIKPRITPSSTETKPPTTDKGKETDPKKVDKEKSPPPPEPPKPTSGSKSRPALEGVDKKSIPFKGNPVDKDLLANPPPLERQPLSYSQQKRMLPPPKTPPPDDDDDEDDDDYFANMEKNWPGYKPKENNPYFLPKKEN